MRQERNGNVMRIMKRILGVFLSVALAAGMAPATAQASDAAASYVALGDSITTGYGLNGEPSFADLLAANIGCTLNDTMARDGATTADLLAQVQNTDNSSALMEADVITVTIGGNDLMAALYEFLAAEYNGGELTADQVRDILMDSSDPMYTQFLVFAAGTVPSFAGSDQAAAAFTAAAANFTSAVSAIKSLNPDVQLIVATQYNPYAYAAGEATGLFAQYASAISEAFDAGVRQLNAAIQMGSTVGGYAVADVYTAFQNAEQNPCNASFDFTAMNLDFHPNAYGHELIAGVMEAQVQPVLPEPEPDTAAPV